MSTTDLIKIGCCGFRSARATYFAALRAVEVQDTFYQPPRVATLEKWRAAAPPDFEFAVKAWQMITHTATSPTYKRLKRELTATERTEAGAFRPTNTVRAAWETTHDCIRALQARMVLFQCPARFQPSGENLANLQRFFTETVRAEEREGLQFGWEPRGDWPPELVRDLCERFDLWHVVDPFAQTTQTPARCYFRLHGRRGWRYTYEDGELYDLLSMLPPKAESYVFFNNVTMNQDAIRFQKLVDDAQSETRTV